MSVCWSGRVRSGSPSSAAISGNRILPQLTGRQCGSLANCAPAWPCARPPSLVIAVDADLTTTADASGNRRNVAVGAEQRLGPLVVRVGGRVNVEAADSTPVGALGLSLELMPDLWLDGQVTGGRDERDRGLGHGDACWVLSGPQLPSRYWSCATDATGCRNRARSAVKMARVSTVARRERKIRAGTRR